MQISRSVIRLATCVALPVIIASAGAGTLPFPSAREALKQGMSAYQGGYYEIAIPALEHAAAAKEFMAEYYLARIYSDNNGAHTDHPKAYMLFQSIADEYADADPDDDPRAPYVGKSLTALGAYVKRGLPEIGLKPDPQRAAFYFMNASSTFNDEDAQFELAKMQLRGEGVDEDVSTARHWLSRLSQNGHAGAQAFLADLLWRGKYMDADQPRALALIAVAVQNAPPYERLWIEDIYQNIYCGAGEGIRKQATGIVAEWGNHYGRKPETQDRSGLGTLVTALERTCQNGEPVGQIHNLGPRGEAEAKVIEAVPRMPTPAVGAAAGFSFGSTAPSLREIGRDGQER